MERVVGHATGGYAVPAVDISAVTVYTNNIPSGAMRGFGVPQVVFAVESCVDELCSMGGFDRWKLRFDNALDEGSKTATGQVLRGVGLKKTLLAVREEFTSARYAGIACGIKNTGVGNGMTDDSEVSIEIIGSDRVVINHGWSEMGQGIHTMAVQTLHQETGIDPSVIEVRVETEAGLPTGMTTSSRATALLGNAIIDASKRLREDLTKGSLEQLKGRVYKGKYICDWTCKPGTDTNEPVIHFAYGYATQVVILDDNGQIKKIIAAHDAGKIMNRMLFEGQIEGAVHMGMGYALTESLPMTDGRPDSLRFNDLGIIRASAMPEIEVIGIEEKDPVGPYGAKGIGEIGMVPTAAAIANALAAFDGIRRTKLPLKRK
jgi:CO/xanthine dehydrogenase Mo-binding subunit